MASSLSSGGKLFVGGTEELVVDAIGVDARGAQAADKVAQEGARAAKINICFGQRGVSLQPVQGDPAGIGILIRAAFVKRFDQNIAMSGRGFAGTSGRMSDPSDPDGLDDSDYGDDIDADWIPDSWKAMDAGDPGPADNGPTGRGRR